MEVCDLVVVVVAGRARAERAKTVVSALRR